MRRFSARKYFEDQYVLRKSIPAFADHVKEWEDLSNGSYFLGLLSEIYRYGDHPRQTFELLKARSEPSKKGLAIFIHGGFWRAISREQSRFMARAFIENGYDCIISEYRLMPEFKMADLVDDTAKMLTLVGDMQRQGQLSDNLLLTGHSAGAHLARFGLHEAKEQGLSFPKLSMIYFSGVFDIQPVTLTSIGDELAMSEDELMKWSVQNGKFEKIANSIFVVGADETDEFNRQSVLGAQFLGQAGDDNIIHVPEANHLTLMTKFAQDQKLANELISMSKPV